MQCSFVWVNAGMKIVMRGRHITHTMTSKYTYDKSNVNIASLFMDRGSEPSLTHTLSLLVVRYQRSSALSVSITVCWKCLSCIGASAHTRHHRNCIYYLLSSDYYLRSPDS